MKSSNFVVNLLLMSYGWKWDIYKVISRQKYIDKSVVSLPLTTLIGKIGNMLDIHKTTVYQTLSHNKISHIMGLSYHLGQRLICWDNTQPSHTRLKYMKWRNYGILLSLRRMYQTRFGTLASHGLSKMEISQQIYPDICRQYYPTALLMVKRHTSPSTWISVLITRLYTSPMVECTFHG